MAQMFTIDGEPQEVTKIREEILNKFNKLEFFEKTHQYFLPQEDGSKIELDSVSHVTHRFSIPFDTEKKAEEYALKHGETKEYWLNEWRYKGLKATTLGTQVHLYGECYAYCKYNIQQFIPDEFKYRYIEDKNWLIPIHKKEEAAKKFWDNLPQNLWYVLSETKVYTNKYAGTFDLLAYYKHPTDDSKSGLVVLDFKTNASLSKDYSRNNNKMLLLPFDDLYDEPIGLYTLQLSAYQIPLEDMGLKIIGRRLIHLKDDGTYEFVPLQDKTKELRNELHLSKHEDNI